MRLVALVAGLLFTSPVWAAITIENPWCPPSMSQANAVGFVTISSDKPDALIGAESNCCAALELHTHRMEDDVITMRKLDKVSLPAGQKVWLRPGGFHLMLIGLKKPLTDGMKVPVTLLFEHAPPHAIEFEVDRARLLERLKSPKR